MQQGRKNSAQILAEMLGGKNMTLNYRRKPYIILYVGGAVLNSRHMEITTESIVAGIVIYLIDMSER